jgi:uncharacterized membrane-anchored protein YhcB (DUF1043 family)
MNWPLIIITGVLLIALIVFLVRRNIKDEKKLEKELNDSTHDSKEKDDDFLINDVLK